MRTGIPSFLITLGTFFVLQGANLGVTKLVTGAVSTPNINQMDGYVALSGRSSPRSFKIGAGDAVEAPCCGGSPSSPCRPGSCSAPRSATGSTPSAATPASARAVGVPVDQGQGRSVHDGGIPGLVRRHAPAVPVQHPAGRQRRRQRVPLHHRRRGGWLPADRRLRQRLGRGHRRVHLRHDQPRHRLRRLGPELVPRPSSASCCCSP